MSYYLFVIILSNIIRISISVTSINKIKQTVQIGEKQELLKLDEYGSVISQNLTFKGIQAKPCEAVRQQISVNDYKYFNIIDNFQDHKTSDEQDSSGTKILDYFIKDSSAYIITDYGMLLHRWLDLDKMSLTQKDIKIQDYTNETFTENKTFFALIKNKWLLIIQEKFQLILDIKQSGEIIEIHTNKDITFERILDVQVLEDFIFISTETFINIYKLENLQLKFIKNLSGLIPVQILIQQTKSQEGIMYILYIDSLQIFPIKILNEEIQVDNPIVQQIDGQDFSQLDIWQNIIMVVQLKDRSSIIDGYQMIDNSMKKFNQWILEGQIQQVKITQNFTIAVDEKQYYFLYHTIGKDENYQKILYPNILNVEVIQLENETFLIGITRKDMMTTQINFHPISLYCYFDEKVLLQTQRILMTYRLNSTDCPEKHEKDNISELCQTQIDFDLLIQRRNMDIFQGNSILVILILLFLIIIWTCFFIRRCYGKQKKDKLRKEFVSFKEFEKKVQKQTFDDINKLPNSQSSIDVLKYPPTMTHLEIEL